MVVYRVKLSHPYRWLVVIAVVQAKSAVSDSNLHNTGNSIESTPSSAMAE